MALLLAREDGLERGPLIGIGPDVDDALGLALALMDWAGPPEQRGVAQSVEAHLAELALLDLHGLATLAVAVARQRVEFAGAAEIAVAATDFDAFELPIDISHDAVPWSKI